MTVVGKYEFNLKVEQMKKLLSQKDYSTAMKIADSIDWRRIKNIKLLTLVSEIYEKNEEYRDAKDILLMAYERAPVGKRILYKLVDLAIKEGKLKEAELYYKEFCEIAPSDARQYLLRYLLMTAEGASAQQRISLLERYKSYDFDEEWGYELAKLYHEAEMAGECVSMCDSLALWFGNGPYVERALLLKQNYEPLTTDQQEILEAKSGSKPKLRVISRTEEETETISEPEDEPEKVMIAVPKVKKKKLLDAVKDEVLDIEIEDILGFDQDKLAKEVEKLTESQPYTEEPEVFQEPEVAEQEVEEDIEDEVSMESEEDSTPLEPDITQEETAVGVLPEAEDEPIFIPKVIRTPKIFKKPVEEEPKEAYIAPNNHLEELVPKDEPDSEPEEDEDEAAEEGAYHIIVRSESDQEGLTLAIAALKKMHEDTDTPINKIAKISGEKLNIRGILKSLDRLEGKNLVIERAGELNGQRLNELDELLAASPSPFAVVLIDRPEVVRKLQKHNPDLVKKFACVVGDSEQLEVKDFVNHARDFAGEIDCVIDDLGMLALYAIAEERVSDGLDMTEAEAEAIIEEAAEMAAKKTLKKMIVSIFSSRYNSEGLLILKEEHFRE